MTSPDHLSKQQEPSSVVTISATSAENLMTPIGNQPTSTGNYIHDVWSTSLYQQCRPFLILLRLGGLFFIHPGSGPITTHNKIHDATSPTRVSNSHKNSPKIWERFERFSIVYSFVVLLICLAFAAKFLYSIIYGISGLPFTQANLSVIVSHFSYMAWITQINISQIIFLRACLSPSRLPELFMKWEYLRYPCPVKECSAPSFGKDFRWRRNVVSFFAVLHCVLQWMSTDFGLIIPSKEYDGLRGALMEGFAWNETAIIVLNFIGGMMTSFVYVVPAYFFTLIAVTLTIDFHHLRHDLHESVKDDGIITIKSLEWFRIRHNCLCVLVDMADAVFSPWIALTLGCNVLQILSQIFLFAATASHWTVITDLTQLYWMMTFFQQLLIILYRGALVNEAVKCCLFRLFG
ncbi:hypothetical protein BV898_08933 [Hypsibius exemplaris]|uniref:Uncharacterized protein n=1 Tax=Hypsibius exemplaris TaxID=2072580 RepID=A0A1W0WP51_HYPEX|nr:hypothetical protein BV898_08933 [Hypsibius exemplaris]